MKQEMFTNSIRNFSNVSQKIIIILLAFPFFMNGQSWEQNYSNGVFDRGYSAIQTTDGGYILTGETDLTNSSNSNLTVIKTNSLGNVLWSKNYGGSGTEIGYSIKELDDGGYIILGESNSYSLATSDSIDAWILKIDMIGDSIWSASYGSYGIDIGFDITTTYDGGYVVTGTSYTNLGNNQLWIFKTDSIGNIIWDKKYGNDWYQVGLGIEATLDSGYIVSGIKYGGCSWLVKTDNNGDTLWTKTDCWNREVEDIEQTTDGGFITTGNGYGDFFLVKTDQYGNTIWDKKYGGINIEKGYDVEQTTDGGYIVAGWTSSFGSGTVDYPDIWLLKTNSLGDSLWSKTFGGLNIDKARSVKQTIDGGYIICGYMYKDILLIKTDGNGNITSTFNIQPPNLNRKLKNIVDILGRESIPIKNTLLFYIYSDGTVEKKIIIE
jgi:hypothetical protein